MQSFSDISEEIESNLRSLSDHGEETILISGAINIGLTETFLRLEASRRGIKLITKFGTYDNPVEDALASRSMSLDGIIFAPFFDGIVQGFESRVLLLSETEHDHIYETFKEKWGAALANVDPSVPVAILGLHSVSQPYVFGEAEITRILKRFNKFLLQLSRLRPATVFVDMEKIIEEVGRVNSLDMRMYYRARNPYRQELAQQIAPRALTALGLGVRPIKVFVVDCDNTLWGGVLEEVGKEGIVLDPNSQNGAIFLDVQRRLLELKSLGALLCVASKNDEADVIEVLDHHEHQLIRSSDFISVRVNWDPKSSNIISLAEELNLGLDSFVLLDDSTYECAEVSTALPEVRVFHVPANLNEYIPLLLRLKEDFLGGRDERIDDKTSQYQIKKATDASRRKIGNEVEFLKSLEIVLEVSVNNQPDLNRLSDMFAKTNQFNATTIRRNAGDIAQLMKTPNVEVISFRIRDKFTSHGITALSVVSSQDAILQVTDFLMSCRILGRGIERGIVAIIAAVAERRGLEFIRIDHAPTSRNGQFGSFLADLSSSFGGITEDSFVKFRTSDLLRARPEWISIQS